MKQTHHLNQPSTTPIWQRVEAALETEQLRKFLGDDGEAMPDYWEDACSDVGLDTH